MTAARLTLVSLVLFWLSFLAFSAGVQVTITVSDYQREAQGTPVVEATQQMTPTLEYKPTETPMSLQVTPTRRPVELTPTRRP